MTELHEREAERFYADSHSSRNLFDGSDYLKIAFALVLLLIIFYTLS